MGKDHAVFWGNDLDQIGELIKYKLKVRIEKLEIPMPCNTD